MPSFAIIFQKKRYKTLFFSAYASTFFNIFRRCSMSTNVNIFRSPPPAFYEVLGIFKKPVRKKLPPLFFILGGGGFFLEFPSDTEKPLSPGLLSFAEIFLQGRGVGSGASGVPLLLSCLRSMPSHFN